jgi:glycosyltransferase involved in cell wall biosynthesis
MGVEGSAGVSAVICTRNRPELLERALTSLVALDPPASEVLVIDNAPSDERTFNLVSGKFPSVRYVREAAAGLNFARNRALAEARFPIVAFMDDDAVADRNWCGALVETFRTGPQIAAATGRIEALKLETEAQRLFEDNGGFSQGLHPIRLPEDTAKPMNGRIAPAIAWTSRLGCGCNLAVRKDLARALDGFDNALDMWPLAPGGGDIDILWRMLDSGHRLEYQPAALVWHEHRRDMAGLHSQMVSHQRGTVTFLVKSLRNAHSGTRAPIAIFLVWRLVKPATRLIKRLLGRDPLPVTVLFKIWWGCWAGLFSYGPARREAAARAAAAGQRVAA